MPGLDYARAAQQPTGVYATARAFYAPVGAHPVVECPDCGRDADADFKDHGGDCLTTLRAVPPRSALGIIRRYAQQHARFSAEDIRAELDARGVKNSARGPAFAAARRKGYIEPDGFERSTGDTAKGAHLQTYRSLIFQPGKAIA